MTYVPGPGTSADGCSVLETQEQGENQARPRRRRLRRQRTRAPSTGCSSPKTGRSNRTWTPRVTPGAQVSPGAPHRTPQRSSQRRQSSQLLRHRPLTQACGHQSCSTTLVQECSGLRRGTRVTSVQYTRNQNTGAAEVTERHRPIHTPSARAHTSVICEHTTARSVRSTTGKEIMGPQNAPQEWRREASAHRGSGSVHGAWRHHCRLRQAPTQRITRGADNVCVSACGPRRVPAETRAVWSACGRPARRAHQASGRGQARSAERGRGQFTALFDSTPRAPLTTALANAIWRSYSDTRGGPRPRRRPTESDVMLPFREDARLREMHFPA